MSRRRFSVRPTWTWEVRKMQEQFSADPHGKDCSCNPVAFPPSMEGRCGKCRSRMEQLSATPSMEIHWNCSRQFSAYTPSMEIHWNCSRQFSAYTPSMELKNEKSTTSHYRVCSSFITVHLVFLCCILLASERTFADEVSVAVASNFKSTLQKISTDFKLASGHDLIISSASSGKLFAQIKHGAPYDVFLSADEKHPDLLIRNKAANSENAYVYALGKLVLISNIEINSDCKNVLSSNRLKHLAIANPEIAPYGMAAKQVLQKLGLWQQLQTRIVMGENVAQTLQFVSTKNAEAGFVAQSLLNMGKIIDRVCSWHVPTDMYAPIKQKMVLLKKAEAKPAALTFIQYMQSAAVKRIIKSSAYDVL